MNSLYYDPVTLALPHLFMEGSTTVAYTLSSGKVPWFDVQCEIQPCDWLGKSHFCMVPV